MGLRTARFLRILHCVNDTHDMARNTSQNLSKLTDPKKREESAIQDALISARIEGIRITREEFDQARLKYGDAVRANWSKQKDILE